jgi:LmbE family N-acetylglucosaminyl deacetylase
MHKLTLGSGASGLRSVLFIGAHCDDIEIGCGGTLLRLLSEYRELSVHWVVFSSNERRAAEARRSAEDFLTDVRSKTIIIKEFRNSFFPYVGAEIKEYFEQLMREVTPDVIFTHRRADVHQDHRTLAELTWNSFRDHLILEYEIAKYEGDLGHPNFFVPLSRETCERKIDIITNTFASQNDKRWFSRDTFLALLRLRGIECNSPSGYAEAFHCRKLIV